MLLQTTEKCYKPHKSFLINTPDSRLLVSLFKCALLLTSVPTRLFSDFRLAREGIAGQARNDEGMTTARVEKFLYPAFNFIPKGLKVITLNRHE